MAGVWRCVVKGFYFGQETCNTLHVRTDNIPGPPTPAEGNAVAETVYGIWTGSFGQAQVILYENRGCDVYSLDDPSVGGTYQETAAGNNNQVGLPAFVTVKVNFLTGFRGRAFRNRTGVSGVSEDLAVGNGLTTGGQTTFLAAAVELVGLLQGQGSAGQIVAVSTVVDGAPRDVPLVTDVLSTTVGALLGSQNRRKG